MKSGQRVPGKGNSKCKGPVGLGKQGGPCDCGEESCEGVGVDQQGREGAKEGGPHWLGEGCDWMPTGRRQTSGEGLASVSLFPGVPGPRKQNLLSSPKSSLAKKLNKEKIREGGRKCPQGRKTTEIVPSSRTDSSLGQKGFLPGTVRTPSALRMQRGGHGRR